MDHDAIVCSMTTLREVQIKMFTPQSGSQSTLLNVDVIYL